MRRDASQMRPCLDCLAGTFSPSPDPLDPLVVDNPPGGRTQHLCGLPITKAAVPAGQLNDVGGQPLLIVWPRRNAPLGRPMLPKHGADSALRQSQLASNVVDAGAAADGA